MKLLKKITLEKWVLIISSVILIGMPLIKFVIYFTKFEFTFKNARILWWTLPVLIITYIYGLIKKKYKFNYFDVLIYIMIITGVIATMKAIKIDVSIYGAYGRYEGLLSLCNYYFLFLNFKNIKENKYKDYIINLIIYIGIAQVCYAIMQVYFDFNFIKDFPKSYMAMGLCGNPNFFGSYMVMICLLTTTLYLEKNKKKYLIFSIILFIGLCLASSTGPFLSFIVSIIFYLIVFRGRYKFKNFILILCLFIISYFSADSSLKYVQKNIYNVEIEDNYNISSEIMDVFNNPTNIGNGRLEVWKNTLTLVKDYGLTGAGIDNFAYVYPQSNGVVYDKAHNIYLQILITNGIFAFMAYFVLCLFVFLLGLRFKETRLIALYMAFIGYSIQGFFNISVVDVAPLFFIIWGMIYSSIKEL